VISAFAGSADCNSFPNLYQVSDTKTIHREKSPETLKLESLYQSVRSYRLNKENDLIKLKAIYQELKKEHPNDWLLSIEMIELSTEEEFTSIIKSALVEIQNSNPELNQLIRDGLTLLEEEKASA
jgi:phenylalanine-4-hydroxylase